MRREGLDPSLGFNLGVGLLFALIFTLIFLMIENGIQDFRRYRASKAARVDPVVSKLLDDPRPRARIGGNRSLRRSQ